MPNTATEHLSASELADQAAHAIGELTRRTRPAGDDLAYPADAAAIIATLAHMTGMLGQLLTQLANWFAHQQQNGRLALDSLAPQPGLAPTMHTLASSLQHAIAHAQHTAEQLDTAHQYAAHLAATEPTTNDHDPKPTARGENSCRSMGPNHLTKRTPSPAPATTDAAAGYGPPPRSPHRPAPQEKPALTPPPTPDPTTGDPTQACANPHEAYPINYTQVVLTERYWV
jgi:hypothetical protein